MTEAPIKTSGTPRPRPEASRAWQAYQYPESQTLRNKLDIHDREKLESLERTLNERPTDGPAPHAAHAGGVQEHPQAPVPGRLRVGRPDPHRRDAPQRADARQHRPPRRLHPDAVHRAGPHNDVQRPEADAGPPTPGGAEAAGRAERRTGGEGGGEPRRRVELRPRLPRRQRPHDAGAGRQPRPRGRPTPQRAGAGPAPRGTAAATRSTPTRRTPPPSPARLPPLSNPASGT